MTQELSLFSLNFLSTQSCTTTSNHQQPPPEFQNHRAGKLFFIFSSSLLLRYSPILFYSLSILKDQIKIFINQEHWRVFMVSKWRFEVFLFINSPRIQDSPHLLSSIQLWLGIFLENYKIFLINFNSKLQVQVSAYLLKCLFQSIFQLLNFLKLNIEIACKFRVDSDYSICFVEFIDLDPFLEP